MRKRAFSSVRDFFNFYPELKPTSRLADALPGKYYQLYASADGNKIHMRRPFPFFDERNIILQDDTELSTGMTLMQEMERGKHLGFDLSVEDCIQIHHNFLQTGRRQGKLEEVISVSRELEAERLVKEKTQEIVVYNILVNAQMADGTATMSLREFAWADGHRYFLFILENKFFPWMI